MLFRSWGGVTFKQVDSGRVELSYRGEDKVLEVDTVIICAGQRARADLADQLEGSGVRVHRVGAARDARGMDAKLAFAEGLELARTL